MPPERKCRMRAVKIVPPGELKDSSLSARDHVECYVEVVKRDTSEVVKRLGPMSVSKADAVRDGMSRNLNHERFYVRLSTEKETP